MIKLAELAHARQESVDVSGKYILPETGQNMALYRDNGFDVMEELADAHNIAFLWAKRLMDAGFWDERRMGLYYNLCLMLYKASMFANEMRESLPYDLRRDLIPVERVGVSDEL